MTVLAFVRHGSTDWNKEGRIQGQRDIPLNKEGREQAKALACRFIHEKWDMIFSSDLGRAKKTAEAIAHHLHIPVICDKRLREAHFGQMEGTTEEERIQKWGENWIELDLGRETIEETSKRGLDFIHEISGKYPDKKIIVVSHGSFLKDTIQSLLQEGERRSGLSNTSVTIVSKNNEVWECTLFNCTKHLDVFA